MLAPKLTFAGLLLASTALFTSSASGQMPLPSQSHTLIDSTKTHGFFCQAPVNFFILGLEVRNVLNQPNQVVEVIDFGAGQPTAFPATITGTQLFYDNQTVSGSIINAVVPCVVGNWYGILSTCTSSSISATSYNPLAVPSAFVSDILGYPTTPLPTCRPRWPPSPVSPLTVATSRAGSRHLSIPNLAFAQHPRPA